MSYDIIYEKGIIKVDEDMYIPLVKIGCNNLYDGNKRVRSWNILNFYRPLKLVYSKKELIDDTKTAIEERLADLTKMYSGEQYKKWDLQYHTNDYLKEWTLEDETYDGLRINSKCARYKDILNMYVNGVKNAIPLDEFLEYNSLRIGYRTYEISPFCNTYTIKSKEDVLNFIKEYAQKKKELDDYNKANDKSREMLYISVDLNGYSDSKINKPFKQKKSTKKEYPFYYAIFSSTYGRYFQKRSSRHTWYSSEGKKFKTEKSATKYLNDHLTYLKNTLTVVKVNHPAYL